MKLLGILLVLCLQYTESFLPVPPSAFRSDIRIAMVSKKALYPFREARKIARGHGFDSKEEFLEYSCPGAYQLPKNPYTIWKEEWGGWDDWLGISYGFEKGRDVARKLNIQTQEAYLKLFEDKKIDDDDPASRLPYRPDLKYKSEWQGWDDWLEK